MEQLIEILHREKCSCVIRTDGNITLCHRRGVRDLLDIVLSGSHSLRGAEVADKVVGKGAAALMVLGSISAVYAGVISVPALRMLEETSIRVTYGTLVPGIINRAGTGMCPVEALCAHCVAPEECLPLIINFVTSSRHADNH